jgi:hypothetical protein
MMRNRVLVIAAAAVLAGLGAVVNCPSGMNAEVAGGVVFVVGTVLGVEWFVEQNNERERERRLRERWEGLGGVPFRGLSGPVGPCRRPRVATHRRPSVRTSGQRLRPARGGSVRGI